MGLDKGETLNNKIFYWVKVNYNLDTELYYSNKEHKPGSIVIIETKHGLESGMILLKSIPISIKYDNIEDYSKIVRKATNKDKDLIQMNKQREPESYKIANKKIKEHNLPLKLLHVHHFLDDKKVMFYFYCENRVDFRSLVRDLASIFKVRIELRQVGVRDEAMFIGGYGICGKPFCCALFGTNKDPKSIKMAREQNLTLNSMRISGVCGRLLCCLDFEYDYYQEDKYQLLEEGKEIIINNDTISKITKIDKDKRIVSIKTISGEKFSIPIESVIVDKEKGKCIAYI
jgi:cell fate regulator YaaT (PSP1 superfamily)